MKIKKVKIEGLDCANCAKVLEGEINKIPCVHSARVEFVKAQIVFESEEPEKALVEIVKVAKAVEPDAKIIGGEKKRKFNIKLFLDFLFLFVGVSLGAIALTVKLPTWAFWTLFVLSVLALGYKTYYKALRLILRGKINENLLITLSVIGAAALGEYMEAVMVVALYSFGKILEGMAVNRSRKSIAALTTLKPDFAVVLADDGSEKEVDPKDVEEGAIILVRAGERVPIDGVVVSGNANLDMQSLTGESVPQFVKEGENILSGAICLDGVLKIRTTGRFENSTLKRIMDLIENAADKKSKTETVISKITKWYTLGVIIVALAVFGIVWVATGNVNDAVYRGLIFLVVSCPCAFAISVPLTYFSGLGNASKKGVLIKGSSYLDALAKMNIVAFDKTGTLTSGNFVVKRVEVLRKDLSEDDVIALAAAGEQYSLHPLAKAIVAKCQGVLEKAENVKEIAGKGVEFELAGKKFFVGRRDLSLAGTIVEVYQQEEIIGRIYLEDEVKSSSVSACRQLGSLGVKTVMLSGDNDGVASEVAQKVGVDEWHAQLMPQDKFAWIDEAKKEKKNFVGYVGDGLNDAPSLMRADVGISMGIKGSEASIEAADVVLVDDNPEKVPLAMRLSKFTRKIVWENILFAAGVKLIFLTLGAVGVTGMLSAVIADVGVTLLAILNSLRALKYKGEKKKKQSMV